MVSWRILARFPACLLPVLMALAGLTACAGNTGYAPAAADNDGTELMSAADARQTLDGLAQMRSHVAEMDNGDQRINDVYIVSVHTTFSAIVINTTDNGAPFKLPLNRLQHLKCSGNETGAITAGVLDCHSDDKIDFYLEWSEDAPEFSRRLWAAIQTLRSEAEQFTSPENDARFKAALQRQQAMHTPEQAPAGASVRLMARAEAAIKDKDFVDAAELYLRASAVDPGWAPAHFNAALVLGESGEYDLAIREMKRYLALAPAASNAPAAQDQVYEWENKLGR